MSDFNGDEAKKYPKCPTQNVQLKNTKFSKSTNSQYFFTKISGIGPWVNDYELEVQSKVTQNIFFISRPISNVIIDHSSNHGQDVHALI